MNKTDEKENEIVVRPMSDLQKELFSSAEPVLERNRQNAKEILAVVLSEVQPVMNIAQAESLADAYQTVDNVVLQKGSDGNYTATLRDEKGKILEHVPLKKSSSCVATAIKEAFAVNCAIAGQAQMMQISKQLEEIQEALSEQKELAWCEKINDVECAMLSFQDALSVENDNVVRLMLIGMSRDRLRNALANVYSFMESQAKRIPSDTSAIGFFKNWGAGKTSTEKAGEYFRYFVWLLPVFCQGMAMLAMTDAYISCGSHSSAIVFARRFKDLLVKCDVQRRMVLVPTICGKDPAKLMAELERGIDTAVEKLEAYSDALPTDQLQLMIPIKERI